MSILGIGLAENQNEVSKRRKKLKGIVIDKGKEYFTFLGDVFETIGNIQEDYNWLISGHECYPQDIKCIKSVSREWIWMTGKELTEMIENEDFQWIWGVFSAFSKEITKERVLEYAIPIANGNDRIWKEPLKTQHPLAAIEVIAWDSSMIIFKSSRHDIIEKIKVRNQFAEDLEEYIKSGKE